MPIVERIGFELMQPTYFFGRNRIIYLCYSLHLSPKSFFLQGKPYFLHHLDIVLSLTLYLLPNSLNVIISVPCETRTHAPQIKNLMLQPAELTEHLFYNCKDIENVFNYQIFLLFLRLFSTKKFSDIIVIDSIFPIINQCSHKSTTYM